jgi:ATP-dependent DNA helicase RecQ
VVGVSGPFFVPVEQLKMPNHIEILKKYFNFPSYRGPQQAIIERTLQGKPSLVIMPTGSGKSLIYQIPALLLADLTIVISPLIALMKDQVDVLRQRGIAAAYVNSSLSREQRLKRYRDIQDGKYKLLYVTPERFRKSDFVEVLQHRKISLLAVDEAHCISEWGHDFRPDYTRLKEFRRLMHNPPTLALTATATPEVQRDIIRQLGLSSREVKLFHEGIERSNLFLEVFDLWGEQEKLKHILDILERHPGNGIIYFVLIKDLRTISEYLTRKKIHHLRYHGDLRADERRRIQDKFMQQQGQLVLATNAFGLGIDKENIRFVIHSQVPASLEIGRAGRDGQSAICSLLYDQQDLNIQLEFIKWNNPSASFYDRLYKLLLAEPERINGEGVEFLREQLTFKNKFDFRLETALGILDRYGVTEGTIESKNLQVSAELPEGLLDQGHLDLKLKNEQQKLYKLVQYVKEKNCRKAFIHRYFGLEHKAECTSCDCHQSHLGGSENLRGGQ